MHAPVDVVFDLSRSIDAHVDSMSTSGEQAIAGVTSGLIGAGESVTWRARHFGLPFTMTSRLTHYECPMRFVDEQVTGSFSYFRHEHDFAERDGVTVMIDRVRFAAPFGLVGRSVERLLLARYVSGLIDERNRFLKKAAETGVPPAGI